MVLFFALQKFKKKNQGYEAIKTKAQVQNGKFECVGAVGDCGGCVNVTSHVKAPVVHASVGNHQKQIFRFMVNLSVIPGPIHIKQNLTQSFTPLLPSHIKQCNYFLVKMSKRRDNIKKCPYCWSGRTFAVRLY